MASRTLLIGVLATSAVTAGCGSVEKGNLAWMEEHFISRTIPKDDPTSERLTESPPLPEGGDDN